MGGGGVRNGGDNLSEENRRLSLSWLLGQTWV